MKPRRLITVWLAGGLLVLGLALPLAGQLCAFSGSPPGDLGQHDGLLKPPSETENSVSSQAALHPGHPMQQGAMIDALALCGTPAEAMARLSDLLRTLPGATLVTQRDDYLYAQFRSRALGFVDDVEFWADPVAGVIQLRSASRLGGKDFGVNRARIEAIRARLLAGP